MPSAASVKIDKQLPSAEIALADNGNTTATPLRQAVTIIEHKIRNLEKRKGKLESYRDMQNSGKELNTDQKTALAKINEVVMTLDFARDLYKQFLGIAASSEKEAKKHAKREASLKNQGELARLREILLVQDALNQMGNEIVRDDFLNGRNGAAQLTENELKLLDDLYPAVTPKHEFGNPTVFVNEVQTAAEHLLAVVDGKPKEVYGGTYSQIKEILGKIHESGYFDQAQETLVEENVADTVIEASVVVEAPEALSEIALAPPIEAASLTNPVIPTASNNRPPPSVVQPPPPLVIDPTSAPAAQLAPTLQDTFFPPSQTQQPPKPITEMLGAGSFFFLQESEIDTPDQITTQTFTNQSFVVQQPPPPIPMPPPHFQAAQQQIVAANLPPNAHQVPPAGVPINQPPTDDSALNKPLVEDMDKHSLGRAHQPQSFYNNGYSNRSSRPPTQQSTRNNGVHQGRPQPARH